MPESTVEYRLGQLDGSINSLISELRDFRLDIAARIQQHDLRDDERFGSHASRLLAIEAQLGEVRIEVAEAKSEGGHGIGLIRHVITAAIAAAAGMFGGHVPLPGGH